MKAVRGALVTGGARGIGYAIAETLATRGDSVTIADIDADRARESCAGLESRGLRVRAVVLDVTDVGQIDRVMTESDKVTPLTTVVCNAGIGLSRGLLDTGETDFERVFAVNVKGVFFTMQAAMRLMTRRGEGSIVAISSTSAFTASSTPMPVYDASKAAVKMLTTAAAREAAKTGIRVNSVAPGTVATDLVKEVLSKQAIARITEERIPMGRLADPYEIAAAVAFLSSDSATYITGHTLVVDGGWLT